MHTHTHTPNTKHQHPNFFGMSQLLDTLIFIQIDLDKLLSELYAQKKECSIRDRASIGGFDMYDRYGGFDSVFEDYYKRVAVDYIAPVAAKADIVIEKGKCTRL